MSMTTRRIMVLSRRRSRLTNRSMNRRVNIGRGIGMTRRFRIMSRIMMTRRTRRLRIMMRIRMTTKGRSSTGRRLTRTRAPSAGAVGVGGRRDPLGGADPIRRRL